jgi:hypothetical protein
MWLLLFFYLRLGSCQEAVGCCQQTHIPQPPLQESWNMTIGRPLVEREPLLFVLLLLRLGDYLGCGLWPSGLLGIEQTENILMTCGAGQRSRISPRATSGFIMIMNHHRKGLPSLRSMFVFAVVRSWPLLPCSGSGMLVALLVDLKTFRVLDGFLMIL